MKNTEVSDDILVEQAGRGDRQAAAMLVRRHSPKVMGMARRMLNNESEAEDVTQEVFLRIWKTAKKWKPGQAKFTTWIHKVTMNLCLDKLRRPKMANSDQVPEMSDQSATPDQSLMEQARAATVRQALATLPDRQRAAVTLCYFEEMSNIDAAAIMEISVDALESLLARGRRGLKTALADQKQDLLVSTAQGASSGFNA